MDETRLPPRAAWDCGYVLIEQVNPTVEWSPATDHQSTKSGPVSLASRTEVLAVTTVPVACVLLIA